MRRGATIDRNRLRRRAPFWTATLMLAALTIPGASSGSASRLSIVVEADMKPVLSDEIYRLDLDGRRADLSRSLEPEGDAHISPDGRLVAFVRGGGGIHAELVALAGGEPKPLTPREHSVVLGPWSPHGDGILAVVANATGARTQLVALAPGRRPRVLATAPSGYDMRSPVWSPDGREVA